MKRLVTPILPVLLILAVVLAVYWPVLNNQAVSFDDERYLFGNPTLQNPSFASAVRVFREILHSPHVDGYYEPLTLVSLMLDVARGGTIDNLRPFHQTSLALHIINTLLVILLMYQFFGKIVPASLIGLLFGLHPMTVEPVAWVWERKTLLAMFFALGSIVLYLRYVRNQTPALSYTTSRLAFILALLAKPTVTPLPLLMLLLDYWPLRRLSRRSVIEKIPFFLVAGISAVITVLSTYNNASLLLPRSTEQIRMPLKIGYLNTFYLGKILWPSQLSSVYTLPEPMSLSNPWVAAGLLATGLLVIIALVALRWTRAIITSWLFFFLAIVPTLGVIGYSWVSASDKYAYLPAVGLLLPLAALLTRQWTAASANRVTRTGLVIAVLIPAVAYTVATRAYLRQWQDSETLMRHMVQLAPQACQPYNELGIALLRKNRYDEAIQCFQDARLRDPNQPSIHNNLGFALARKQQWGEAIPCLERALELKPDYLQARNNLEVAYGKIAQRHVQANRTTEAIQHYRRAMEFQPDSVKTANNLAWYLATNPSATPDEIAEATALAKRACQQTRFEQHAYLDTLAAAYAAAGHFEEAAQTIRKGIELASTAGEPTAANDMRNRLRLYEAGRPYHEEPKPVTTTQSSP